MRIVRAFASLLVLVGMVGLGLAARRAPAVVEPTFTFLGDATMPFVPDGSFITSSWYCPGVAIGEGRGGNVVVTNTGDEAIGGRLTVFTTADQPPISATITVPARSSQTVDLVQLQPSGEFVSALVEIDGGGGFVEQEALDPLGNAVAACSNATSSNWYFADGFTVDGGDIQLVLTNPFPDAAVVNVSFVTERGDRDPNRFRGFNVPGRSIRVVDFGSGAKDERVIATQVIATHGRVVAARNQHYVGGGRYGHTMSLGAPSLSSQYYFADGEVGDDITEEYRLFNPTDQDVNVDVIFLGIESAEFPNDTEVTVPARDQLILDTSEIEGLPEGRHGAVFSTLADPSIVVERVLTRPAGDGIATTVVMGSPSTLASTRWSGAISTDLAIEDVLVVLNVDNVDATVTVSTLGPGGLVPVAGLEEVAVGRGGVVSIPMTDPSALGRPFVVESAQRLYVERLLPRGDDLRGRSGSFALAG